jgi:hypothetical protein
MVKYCKLLNLVHAPGREGFRECNVNGTPLTDRDLFTEAWGQELADDILCRNRGLTQNAGVGNLFVGRIGAIVTFGLTGESPECPKEFPHVRS